MLHVVCSAESCFQFVGSQSLGKFVVVAQQQYVPNCMLPLTAMLPEHVVLLSGDFGNAVEEGAWQDIPLGLDPRVRDLLGNSVALNTTASVKQAEDSGTFCVSSGLTHCTRICCMHLLQRQLFCSCMCMDQYILHSSQA